MAEIVIEGLDQFQAKLAAMSAEAKRRIAKDAVDEGAAVVQFHAQMNARNVFGRRQRGQLRNSIYPESRTTETGAEAVIGPHVIYGRIQEFGGTIRPVQKQVLHFKIDGQDVFTKKVTLPARPYLAPAVNDHKDQIIDVMAASILDNLAEFEA